MSAGAVDAHHHLWDPARREYPWLTGAALNPIRRRYDTDELRRYTAANDVAATVLVQTVSTVAETEEFLATAAGSDGLIAGVVGWVDLTRPGVSEAIARLRDGAGGDRLVGVRHQVQDEDDPEWLLRPEVVRGLCEIGEAGLAYDLLVTTAQLPAARAVAALLPEIRFVLDHAAKPPIAAGETEPWASEISALANADNVSCKLSGLITEARWGDWDAFSIAPYAAHVLEAFGPGRVLFGSDWPVCELAGTYGDVVGLARALTADLSTAERASVFGGTAREVYNLHGAQR